MHGRLLVSLGFSGMKRTLCLHWAAGKRRWRIVSPEGRDLQRSLAAASVVATVGRVKHTHIEETGLSEL